MPTTTIDGHVIHVDDEGFMTEYTVERAAGQGDGPDRHRDDRRALERRSASCAPTSPTRARPRRCAG